MEVLCKFDGRYWAGILYSCNPVFLGYRFNRGSFNYLKLISREGKKPLFVFNK